MIGTRRYEAEAETPPSVEIRWFAVPHDHEDEQALQVLTDLLNGETGRLQMSLVKGQKIAASANGNLDARKYGGFIGVQAVAAPGHETGELENALVTEIKRLQDEPVPDDELQKVKNQALAQKFRRLDGNFLIMIQLLIYDAEGTWRDMLTESDRYLKVTADDVQRVAKKYLDMGTRTTAVYRTKAGAGQTDPLFDKLTPDQQAMARQMKTQLGAVTDVDKLQQILAGVSSQKDAAPPDQKPVAEWLEKFLQDRIASLKGGAK
jgi:predicted Zn-dependent peptidase